MSAGAGFRLSRGANRLEDGGVQFEVWAPRAERVEVELAASGRRIALSADEQGVHSGVARDIPTDSDYFFVLDGSRRRPDPVSRFQPAGVHGPSRIVDPNAFAWTDAGWRGISREKLCIYELHVGTFTAAGTFEAVIDQLDHLCDLGVTALELMPVAEFPGARNWGYDGVHLYAPQSTYGGPLGMKRLIDACHARGLGVILDVVYNHLGPDGNHLSEFGPYFSDRYRTPWGEALNFDSEDSDWVRRHFIDNALYWLTEFHVDGLRLDAVHAIFDFSAEHVLSELAREFHAEARRLDRHACLIAESDLNDTRVTRSPEAGGWQLDSQWSDDFHHALFTALSGARHGYFADFGSLADLHKAITEGFVYDGRYSAFRRRRHGQSAAARPGCELVVFAQNHDQISNASRGHRLADLVSPSAERLAAVVLASAPNIVMLFQGQEWGETAPFHYFTQHTDPGLAKAVREGRLAEYRSFGAGDEFRDPQEERAFLESKIDWTKLDRPEHAGLYRLYRELLRLRASTPALANCRKDLTRCLHDDRERWMTIERSDPAGSFAIVLANFSDEPRALPVPARWGARRALWSLDQQFWKLPPKLAEPPTRLEEHALVTLAPVSAAVYVSD